MKLANVTARQMMNSDVVSVSPETSVKEAMQSMLDRHVGSLPVVDDAARVLGVVSARDILKGRAAQDEAEGEATGPEGGMYFDPETESWEEVALWGGLEEMPDQTASDVMSDQVIFVLPGAAAVDVAETMLSQGIHHVLVLDEHRRLQGIISAMDFARLVTQLKG